MVYPLHVYSDTYSLASYIRTDYNRAYNIIMHEFWRGGAG